MTGGSGPTRLTAVNNGGPTRQPRQAKPTVRVARIRLVPATQQQREAAVTALAALIVTYTHGRPSTTQPGDTGDTGDTTQEAA